MMQLPGYTHSKIVKKNIQEEKKNKQEEEKNINRDRVDDLLGVR